MLCCVRERGRERREWERERERERGRDGERQWREIEREAILHVCMC